MRQRRGAGALRADRHQPGPARRHPRRPPSDARDGVRQPARTSTGPSPSPGPAFYGQSTAGRTARGSTSTSRRSAPTSSAILDGALDDGAAMRRRILAIGAACRAGHVPARACGLIGGGDTYQLTAYFDRAVSVFPSSDVRVLGPALPGRSRRSSSTATRCASTCRSRLTSRSPPTPPPRSCPSR